MLRLLIVDDEEHALNMLEMLLKDNPNIEIVGKYTDPFAALEAIERTKVDCVFLDIEMSGMTGIELAEEIKILRNDLAIVFVTAYSEYAVKAFELYSIDYLLKPVTKKRIQLTLDRLFMTLSDQQPESNELYVKYFGSFNIYTKSGEAFPWKTYKVRELCAYLLHHQHSFVSKERIIDEVWPTINYEKAKINFYTCISFLRKMFRECGYPDVLTKSSEGYQLKLECPSDLKDFELIDTNDGILTDENVKEMKHALSVYKGHYMEENGYLWCQDKRQALRARFVEALSELACYYMDKYDYEQAIQYLETVAAYDPVNERMHQELMKLYNKTNNRSEAFKIFFALEQSLKEDFGGKPSKETEWLFSQLKEGKPI